MKSEIIGVLELEIFYRTVRFGIHAGWALGGQEFRDDIIVGFRDFGA
jgi:hypothetical protein